MAISFIDSNVQDSGGALSLTFTVPAAAQAGDLILVFVKQSENTSERIWDDDGGGGNGYTREQYNRTTGGRDQETAIFWKIHTGSEANPTFTWASGITVEPMSGTMLIYRGVDPNIPLANVGYQSAQNDANPPNPSVNVTNPNSWVVCFHAATHDDISAVAPPTGFTLRTQVWSGTANDHRNHFTADISGIGVGIYTPPDWQHSVLNTTPEYHTYSVALNEIQPIGVLSTDGQLNYGGQDTVIGFGFGATQGTGKVELWSDLVGTIKTVQAIDSWADGAITFTSTQGALDDNTSVYIVVTNDNGDASSPLKVNVGLAPYHAIIEAQNPDHWWKFDNDGYADSGVAGSSPFTQTPVNGGGAFEATPICDQNTHSWRCQSGQRREAPNSPNMNAATTQNRLMGGWIRVEGIPKVLSCIYEEGGGVNNITFLIGLGNRVFASYADTGDDNVQAFGDKPLTPSRPYHILFRFSHTDATKEFTMYIDGVKQAVTAGNPLTSGDLDSHSGDISIGGGGGNLEVGGTDVAFQTVQDMYYANWVTWSESKSDADILELFQRGALPDLTIAADTSVNMQIALDVIANTVRRDWPLCIRLEQPTDSVSLSLNADNITFEGGATLQLEWRGVGTLTWTNLNGSNLVAEKVLASNGGSINIVNPAVLTLTGLQDGTEVRVYQAGTDTEIAGAESVTGGTFATSIEDPSVDIVIHALYYLNQKLTAVDMSGGDVSLPIQQRFDRQYNNPT